jgi:phosphoenolpyruvate---glycerone phosphotransferase subunit DhaK
MKKFYNSVDTILAESLAGFAAAHADIVSVGGDGRFVRRRRLSRGKVALISGGGAGHEPMHAGYVGHGMLDAACPGQVFTSPTPDQIAAALAAVAGRKGALFIVKNYQGDLLNFEMATEMAVVPVRSLVVSDDVALTETHFGTGRRGLAGTVILEKITGAAAEQGMGLDALLALGEAVNARTRTMAVALTSATSPAVGRPGYDLGASEMEFGVGIHGEPGTRRGQIARADEIAAEICQSILAELSKAARRPRDALLVVNGFGATPLMELYLMYHAVCRILARHGIRVKRRLVGNYATSLDTAGCSVTLSLLDATEFALWDSPVHTAALRWGM